MKRKTMKEIFEKIDKQLENLQYDALKALDIGNLNRYFEIDGEKKGVLFVYHLLKGNEELIKLYEKEGDE